MISWKNFEGYNTKPLVDGTPSFYVSSPLCFDIFQREPFDVDT
jgi:hypothetical protein